MKKIKITEEQAKKLSEDLVQKSNIDGWVKKSDISALAHHYAKSNDIIKKNILDTASKEKGEVFANKIKIRAKEILENNIIDENKIIVDKEKDMFDKKAKAPKKAKPISEDTDDINKSVNSNNPVDPQGMVDEEIFDDNALTGDANLEEPLEETTMTAGSNGSYSSKFFVDPKHGKGQKPLWAGGEIIQPNRKQHNQGVDSFKVTKKSLKESTLNERHHSYIDTEEPILNEANQLDKVKSYVKREELKLGQIELGGWNGYNGDELAKIIIASKNEDEFAKRIYKLVYREWDGTKLSKLRLQQATEYFNRAVRELGLKREITPVDPNKINQSEYTTYVCMQFEGKPLKLISGYQYPNDAKEYAQEVKENFPEAKVSVYSKSFLIKNGINPDDNNSWGSDTREGNNLDEDTIPVLNIDENDSMIDEGLFGGRKKELGIVKFSLDKYLTGDYDVVTQSGNNKVKIVATDLTGKYNIGAVVKISVANDIIIRCDKYGNSVNAKDFNLYLVPKNKEKMNQPENNDNIYPIKKDLGSFNPTKKSINDFNPIDECDNMDEEFLKELDEYENTDKLDDTGAADEPEDNFDITDAIISYENGSLPTKECIELFSHLLKNGLAYKLQGSYGRTAHSLIDDGILDNEGNIDWDKANEMIDSGDINDSEFDDEDYSDYEVDNGNMDDDILNEYGDNSRTDTMEDALDYQNMDNDIVDEDLSDDYSKTPWNVTVGIMNNPETPENIKSYAHRLLKQYNIASGSSILKNELYDFAEENKHYANYYGELTEDSFGTDIDMSVDEDYTEYDVPTHMNNDADKTMMGENGYDSLDGIYPDYEELFIKELIAYYKKYWNIKLNSTNDKFRKSYAPILPMGIISMVAKEYFIPREKAFEIAKNIMKNHGKYKPNKEGNDIDETTSAGGSSGAFNGRLMGRKNTKTDMIFEDEPEMDKENYTVKDLIQIIDAVKEDMGEDHEVFHKLVDELDKYDLPFDNLNLDAPESLVDYFKKVLDNNESTEHAIEPELNEFDMLNEEEKISSAFTNLKKIRDANAKITKADMNNIKNLTLKANKSNGVQFVQDVKDGAEPDSQYIKDDHTYQQSEVNKIKKGMEDLSYETQPSEMFEKAFEKNINPPKKSAKVKDQYGFEVPEEEYANVEESDLGDRILADIKKKKDAGKEPMYNKDIQPVKVIKEAEEEHDFLAYYNSKKELIKAKSLYDAKLKAIAKFNIPKSKQGLLSVVSQKSQDKEDFRFNESIVSEAKDKEVEKEMKGKAFDDKKTKDIVPTDIDTLEEVEDNDGDIVAETDDMIITKQEKQKIDEEIEKTKKLYGYRPEKYVSTRNNTLNNDLFKTKKK